MTILYTAPTAIRAVHEVGRRVRPSSTTSRRCGCWARWASRSTRRPGSGTASTSAATACPIVDTWWQTETGMIMITPLPGVTTTKPGSATRPFPGIDADVVDERGQEVAPGGGGYLVLRRPWPAMLRGIFGDDDALPRDVLVASTRARTSQATAPARRRRRLLAAGPGRRRHERLRPPHLDDRGGVGAGRPPGRGRGGRVRADGRAHRPGDRGLRDAEGQRTRARSRC